MGFHVVLCGVFGVLDSLHMVTVGEMSVMSRSLGVAFVVMPCGFSVVACSVLVVLRCLAVMMRSFVRHRQFLSVSVRACGTGGLWSRASTRGLQEGEFGVNI